MFGFPTWLTIFLIAYFAMIIGVWALSYSGVLFQEDDEDENNKKVGGHE